MDRHSWTASLIGMLALLCALLLVAGVASAAPPPLLPERAFRPPQACAVEPFTDPSVGQQEQLLEQDCGADVTRVRLNTPRAKPIDTGPSRVEMDVDQLVTWRTESLTASARIGWGGASPTAQPLLQTQRALVAVGGLWRLYDGLALDMNVGHDLGPGQRRRASATALFRPAGQHLLFVQVASEEAGLAPAVGMRWWLAERRASFDVMARRAADGQAIEPRVGLQIYGR